MAERKEKAGLASMFIGGLLILGGVGGMDTGTGLTTGVLITGAGLLFLAIAAQLLKE